jgi:peptide/nickel transport system permease protein
MRRYPLISGSLALVLILMAILGPIVAPHDPLDHSLKRRNIPPAWTAEGSGTYVLGTDILGRDVLSRVIYGARVSLIVAAIALATGITIGTGLGFMAGYYGGIVDEIITRTVDVWMGVPFILVALVLSMALGPSLQTMIILLAILAWTPFVRQVRGEVLSLRERDYVALARIAGASTWRLFLKHILPGVTNTILVLATFRVANLILTEAFLSFLGAGIPPPTPTWGNMISEGRDYLQDAWWISVFPGIAILLTASSLSFLGDWIRDFTDPMLRQLEE